MERRKFIAAIGAAVAGGGLITEGGRRGYRVGRKHWNRDLREMFAVKACNHTLMVDVLDVIHTQQRFTVAQMLALAQTESDGRWDAKSGKGALGAWQIMPIHGRKKGYTEEDLMDPRLNCELAIEILGGMADEWPVEYHHISAYNCGWTTWTNVMAGKEHPKKETERHWSTYRLAKKKYEDWIDRGIWRDDRCYPG